MSLLKDLLGKQLCSCYLDGRGGQIANRHKAVAWGLCLGGMPFNKKQWLVSPLQELIPQVMFIFFGNQSKKVNLPTQRSLRWDLVRNQKEHSQIREGEQLTHCLWIWSPVALAIEGSDLCIPEDNFCAYCKMNTGTKKRTTGDQIKSFRDCDVAYAISIMSKQWKHLIVFTQFFAKVHKKVQRWRVDVIAGDANAAENKCYKRQK